RFEVRVERRLRIDDEIARVWHVHDEIRSQRAFVAHHVELLAEIAVLREPGELDHATQSELAPPAAHLGASESRHEIARLALELHLAVRQGLDLSAECRERLAALALERLDLR